MGQPLEAQVRFHQINQDPAMVLSERGQKDPKGFLFAAMIARKRKQMQYLWPAKTPIVVFRRIVEEHCGGKVAQDEADGCYWIELEGKGFYQEITPSNNILEAKGWLNLSETSGVENSLKEISWVVGETTVMPLLLEPDSFCKQLIKFIDKYPV